VKLRGGPNRAVRKHRRRAAAIFATRTPAQSLLMAVSDEPDYGAGYESAENGSRDAGLRRPDQRRHYGLGIVAELVNAGYVVLGEQTADGFVPWDTSAGESLVRLERVWRERGDSWWEPEGWMLATEAGLAEADRILATEDWSWAKK